MIDQHSAIRICMNLVHCFLLAIQITWSTVTLTLFSAGGTDPNFKGHETFLGCLTTLFMFRKITIQKRHELHVYRQRRAPPFTRALYVFCHTSQTSVAYRSWMCGTSETTSRGITMTSERCSWNNSGLWRALGSRQYKPTRNATRIGGKMNTTGCGWAGRSDAWACAIRMKHLKMARTRTSMSGPIPKCKKNALSAITKCRSFGEAVFCFKSRSVWVPKGINALFGEVVIQLLA